jgi:hypothetical protein
LNGDPKLLWAEVKPHVRKVENTGVGYLIIDDTIEEKPYTDQSELVNWHYSHSKHSQLKGINILSALIRYGDVALPIDYHLVTKSTSYIDKHGKTKYKSDIKMKQPVILLLQQNIIRLNLNTYWLIYGSLQVKIWIISIQLARSLFLVVKPIV